MNPTLAAKLTDDVLGLLNSNYRLESGEVVQGQSISHVVDELREMGWKNLGPMHFFESDLEALGFKVLQARSIGRNQRATIVTL